MPPLETFAKYRWQLEYTVVLVSLTELLIVRRVIVTSPPLPSLSTVSTVHRRLGCCYQVYFIKDWTGKVSCQPWIWNKCIDNRYKQSRAWSWVAETKYCRTLCCVCVYCAENCVRSLWAGSLCGVHSAVVSTLGWILRDPGSIPGEHTANFSPSLR